LAGGLATAPAAGIEWWFLGDEPENQLATISTLAVAMFVVVGPVEEGFKFAAVRFGVYRSSYFEEPVDGLIYAAAAGLGFASVENVFYAVQFGPEIMFARGPISTLAHVVFASIWGLGLSRKTTGQGTNVGLLLTVGLAALLHGAFNAALFHPAGFLVSFAIVGVGTLVFVRMLRRATADSKFKLKQNVPELQCVYCNHLYRMGDPECTWCRKPAEEAVGAIHCSFCSGVNIPGAKYCAGCGDYFVSRSFSWK
jgi:RsiW-degrading membrane proteinase PrsW (M82 family)